MNRLRNRLILVFVLATLLPLCLTLWTALNLLDVSRGIFESPLAQLDEVSKSLEFTGQKLYQQTRDTLRRDATESRVMPRHLEPSKAQSFWDSRAPEQFELSGEGGDTLDYYVRGANEVLVYSRPMGLPMRELTRQYARARKSLEDSSARD